MIVDSEVSGNSGCLDVKPRALESDFNGFARTRSGGVDGAILEHALGRSADRFTAVRCGPSAPEVLSHGNLCAEPWPESRHSGYLGALRLGRLLMWR